MRQVDDWLLNNAIMSNEERIWHFIDAMIVEYRHAYAREPHFTCKNRYLSHFMMTY